MTLDKHEHRNGIGKRSDNIGTAPDKHSIAASARQMSL